MIEVNVCLGRGKGLGKRRGGGAEREVQARCKCVHVAGVSIVAAGCPHSMIDI